MNKKLFITVILGIFILSFASAESLSPKKINEPMQITNYCQDGTCTYMNLVDIEYPNNTIIYPNAQMTNNNQSFNYSFIPDQLGIYSFKTCGDPSGKIYCDRDTFIVSNNGKEDADSGIIIFFSMLFILIVMTMLTLLFATIFRMIAWDFDAKDLIFNFSAYFGIFVTHILSKQYLGNQFMNEFLVWLIGIGSLTMIILPIIAFVLNIVKGNLKSNE